MVCPWCPPGISFMSPQCPLGFSLVSPWHLLHIPSTSPWCPHLGGPPGATSRRPLPPPPQPRERESPARLPTGPEALPERMPRPDRPRARDRPKPRRRPRPKDPAQGPGETRRSRSAPAQGSAPPPPPPPTHTVQHEGFLFRKHELDGPNKKASNRLVGDNGGGGGRVEVCKGRGCTRGWGLHQW